MTFLVTKNARTIVSIIQQKFSDVSGEQSLTPIERKERLSKAILEFEKTIIQQEQEEASYSDHLIGYPFGVPLSMNSLFEIRQRKIQHLSEQLERLKKDINEENEENDSFDYSTLPAGLHQQIVDFFLSLPTIDEIKTRRAILCNAGLDKHLYHQIDQEGSSAQFSPILVSNLYKYGKLKDGRNALTALLESSRNWVGQEKKQCATS